MAVRGRYVLAIDNGSQSTKVSLIDVDGVVHARARVGLRPYATSSEGRVVHPEDDVWDSIAAACRMLFSRFAGDRAEIVAVGLCTIRFCRAVLDADGLLSEPMMSWMDSRVGRPYEPADDRARFVTTSSGYATHRLTGAFVDTAANYQGVWPIDPLTWRWSEDPQPYRATGMARERLFELVDPGGLLGCVTEPASRETGIPAGLPVYATANDKAVEALGAGLRSPTELVLSLGTYVAAMTVGSDPTPAEAYWVNFGSRPHQYLYESEGIRRGMWTVSWFRSLLEAEPGQGERLYSLEAELNAGAVSVAAGSGGLMTVLDWLAPAHQPSRRGAFVGFDGSQDRFHIYRSILEGLVFTMADHSAAMADALGREFDRVVLTGGGARSAVIAEIAANVFDMPIERAEAEDCTGTGAAICAAVGSGMHSSWDDAVTAMVRRESVAEPDRALVRRYQPFRRRHTELRSRVHELTEWMASP
ncbi:MAG: sugar kinase [Micrococcales bacterium]|nr:sugar kinase [Micrococcales bacterium]